MESQQPSAVVEEEPIGILVHAEHPGMIGRAAAQEHHRSELIGDPVSLGVQELSVPAHFLGKELNTEGGLPELDQWERGDEAKTTAVDRVHSGLAWFGRLYQIEREARKQVGEASAATRVAEPPRCS